MIVTAENILFVGAILVFSSILISKTGYRFGIPTLLLFLLAGMLFGSDGLGVEFSNVGDAQFVGIIALSIILFTGGMDTRLSDIQPVLRQGIVLSTVGVLLTTLLTGGFIYLLSFWKPVGLTLPLLTCLLLSATMSSTDSASVFNLLRSQKMNLKHNLRPMLELESGSNDPMAYMLTLVLIQIIGSCQGLQAGIVLRDLMIQFVIGGSLGYAIGIFSVKFINHIHLSNSSLYPILLLSIVFFTFTLTDQLKGNGYLAVYIMGVMVGNHRLVFRREIQTFMNGMTWLFQIILFLTLGLLVEPHEMFKVAPAALLIGLFMIFFARPLSVWACLLPFRGISAKARCFVSWVGLRGAVPIIFATYPVLAGIPGSDRLFNIVFFITLLSLIVQGMTISQAAIRLGLDAPLEKEGNDFGIELPEDINSSLAEMELTADMLAQGNRLADMHLPQGTLVMMVKRGTRFMVPNGQLELMPGDKLLLISETR